MTSNCGPNRLHGIGLRNHRIGSGWAGASSWPMRRKRSSVVKLRPKKVVSIRGTPATFNKRDMKIFGPQLIAVAKLWIGPHSSSIGAITDHPSRKIVREERNLVNGLSLLVPSTLTAVTPRN